MNNKGAEKITSLYWFVILFIVAGAIVYMASVYYGEPYDVRNVEGKILSEQVANCLSKGGYLKEEVLSENFENNFLDRCDLNFNVEEGYKEGQLQYYLDIGIFEFKENSPSLLGERVFNFTKGNENLRFSYGDERADINTIVIHYTAGSSAEGAMNTLERRGLSTHYIIGKDGEIYSPSNTDSNSLVNEEIIAQHAGCRVRTENNQWESRPECSSEFPECINSEGLLKENCTSLNPGLCCISGFNQKSIGIEIVNLGDSCTGGTCVKTEGRNWEPYNEKQINSVINLISEIVARHDIPVDRNHIIGHEEITTDKSDPGPLFPWEKVIDNVEGQEKFPGGRSFYVLNREEGEERQYVIKVLSLVGKSEKNVA